MESENGSREAFVARALMVFADDTVMSALRLMQEHDVPILAVVDDANGQLLGEIRIEELYRLWSTAPLARMDAVLRARARAVRHLAEQNTLTSATQWLH